MNCNLCPRNCKVNRENNEMGVCGQTTTVQLARAALHYWEEPCISGEEGSGAVFFSGCTLRCVFCQNREIARGTVGKTVTVERLRDIFLELQEKGANNINLVTAGHFAHQVVRALHMAKEKGLIIPIVYNTSGYEKVETLKMFEGLVDIYLPDFKYYDKVLAKKYSNAEDYPEVAKLAIAEMVRQTGSPKFVDDDDEKLLLKGTVVRHLVLPDCMEDSKNVLKYLHETYGSAIYISIMNQFTPLSFIEKDFPELNRRITEEEYEELVDYAIDIGIEQGFIQEGETAEESFIPDFDYEGV